MEERGVSGPEGRADAGRLQRLHHDLRSALLAVGATLETLAALENGGVDATSKRRALIARAIQAFQQSVAIADELRAAEIRETDEDRSADDRP